ncbi:hypothetical protein HanXRQr2_Chr02g0048801 [Helianthus annuus]|uniref:Uncharacterized protein n=1 Tax=Helianthus annuus TaxID=4232 RepID=A0A9K3JMA3_HELAN|nr:hypothetical protein HanXRQr2_Chr02g0048801 [Helianthus annuus]
MGMIHIPLQVKGPIATKSCTPEIKTSPIVQSVVFFSESDDQNIAMGMIHIPLQVKGPITTKSCTPEIKTSPIVQSVFFSESDDQNSINECLHRLRKNGLFDPE